ncbi:hypothetical protein HPB48_001679 [Haemaphysalis longicornis]|uniref:DDE-1 domain-containing protein n=1 Tax=Haemaphysalis longicornis TaxID=44386 RepID=A0A9J6F6M6_HAELO|nr:hypothetical protein HPB48_001679 [Haemaphysalis longicornis]
MTCSLFQEFFSYMDSKIGCRNRKVILFLDNCSAHPKATTSLRNVKVVDCDELNSAMETVGANGIAYASVDDVVVTAAVLSIDDIVAECAGACSSDDEVEEEQPPEPEPTSPSAVAALDLLRRYARSDDAETQMALPVLKKHLVLLGRDKMRQATLHDFFERR